MSRATPTTRVHQRDDPNIKASPTDVAAAVPAHHICRALRSAAAVPGNSGASPKAGARKKARKSGYTEHQTHARARRVTPQHVDRDEEKRIAQPHQQVRPQSEQPPFPTVLRLPI